MPADSKVTVVRGDYQIGPSSAWTDAAATWPVVIVHRETSPDGKSAGGSGEDGLMLADHLGPRSVGFSVPQMHLCCAVCPGHPSVLCLCPDTRTDEVYQFRTADMLAGILGHLRRSHPDVVES